MGRNGAKSYGPYHFRHRVAVRISRSWNTVHRQDKQGIWQISAGASSSLSSPGSSSSGYAMTSTIYSRLRTTHLILRRQIPGLPVLPTRVRGWSSANLVAGTASFEVDRSTLSSVTLHGSGRSTPQANSVYSGHTIATEAPALQDVSLDFNKEFYRPLEQTSTAQWSAYPSTDSRNAPHLPTGQDALCDTRDVRSSAAHISNPTTLQAVEPAKGPHFCVYCSVDHVERFIGTKQDWKRHQEDFHPETGNQWHCKLCPMVFDSGKPFKDHLKDQHGKVYPKDCKKVIQDDRVYACGFEHCRELKDSWRLFCDHVSTHMKEGRRDWSYDRTIRNLLKHPDVATTWKDIYSNLGTRYNIRPIQLTWDPKTTREMRQALEYHRFGPSLQEFLQDVFFKGLSKQDMAAPVTNPPPSSILPPPPPPVVASDTYQNAPNVFEDWPGFTETDLSLYKEISNFGSVEQSTSSIRPGVSAYRNSCAMTEAPPLFDCGSPNFDVGVQGEISQTFTNVEDFVHESNPGYSNHNLVTTQESSHPSDSKKSRPQRLMSLSKNWVNKKKSQHFQQHPTFEHPDLPLNTRMPRSRTETPASTYLINPTAGLYSI